MLGDGRLRPSPSHPRGWSRPAGHDGCRSGAAAGDRVGELEGRGQQLQRPSEVVQRPVSQLRVEVVAEDRHAQPAHVQPQLVGTAGARGEPVAAQAVAVLEQLDPGLGVGRPGLLGGGDDPAPLDDAAATACGAAAGPGRGGRWPGRSCAPGGPGTASGRRPRCSGRTTNISRPAVTRSSRCAGLSVGSSSWPRSRTSAVCTMCRPRGMVAKKCGLSTTTRQFVLVEDVDLERHRDLGRQVAMEPEERVRYERGVRGKRAVGVHDPLLGAAWRRSGPGRPGAAARPGGRAC